MLQTHLPNNIASQHLPKFKQQQETGNDVTTQHNGTNIQAGGEGDTQTTQIRCRLPHQSENGLFLCIVCYKYQHFIINVTTETSDT